MNKLNALKFIIVLSTVLPCFGGDTDDSLRDGRMFREKNIQRHLKELKSKLDLTDDQYQRLHKHKTESRNEMKAKRKVFRDKRSEIINEIQQESMNMSKINTLHNQAKVLKIEMLDFRLQRMLKVRDILTPDQFKHMHEFMREKRSKHRKRVKMKE